MAGAAVGLDMPALQPHCIVAAGAAVTQVIDVCSSANRNLRILRARFSALIPRELQRAMQQLVAPNAADAAAVDARQEIDLRVGASFTRLQTLLLQVSRLATVSVQHSGEQQSYSGQGLPILQRLPQKLMDTTAGDVTSLVQARTQASATVATWCPYCLLFAVQV